MSDISLNADEAVALLNFLPVIVHKDAAIQGLYDRLIEDFIPPGRVAEKAYMLESCKLLSEWSRMRDAGKAGTEEAESLWAQLVDLGTLDDARRRYDETPHERPENAPEARF